MITDEDYEKYIGIHMPNVRKLTLECTEKTVDVDKNGQVISMIHYSSEVLGLRIASDPKGCEINVQYVEDYTGDINDHTFVLPTNDFNKWNQAIDNNNIGDQRYGVVLIEFNKAKLHARSGHETAYKSIKLILNK